MTKRAKKKTEKSGRAKTREANPPVSPLCRLWGWLWRGLFLAFAFAAALILLFRFVNPPTTIYMMSESRRLGGVDFQWVPYEEIPAALPLSIMAAEDANFCSHWGFDMEAIRAALESGGKRGASSISQQTVKNVFLWQGRSWSRKALEAVLTPMVELLWTKRRILEVYMNVVEFDEGVFGVDAAAYRYFKVPVGRLDPVQAARLAAILPDPKGRDAARPSGFVRERTRQIMDGVATLRAEERAACLND